MSESKDCWLANLCAAHGKLSAACRASDDPRFNPNPSRCTPAEKQIIQLLANISQKLDKLTSKK